MFNNKTSVGRKAPGPDRVNPRYHLFGKCRARAGRPYLPAIASAQARQAGVGAGFIPARSELKLWSLPSARTIIEE